MLLSLQKNFKLVVSIFLNQLLQSIGLKHVKQIRKMHEIHCISCKIGATL